MTICISAKDGGTPLDFDFDLSLGFVFFEAFTRLSFVFDFGRDSIGLLRGFGTIGFPGFTDGLIYAAMIVILVFRPQGLFGRRTV